MKRIHLVFVVLSMLLVFAFISCEGKTPTQVEGLTVSAYKPVTLSDLAIFDSEFIPDDQLVGIEIPSLSADDTSLEQMLFGDALDTLMTVLDNFRDGDGVISPLSSRSIDAGFQLFVRNEGLELTGEEDDDDDFIPYSEIDVEHLDITLSGRINSLSNLLTLIHGDVDMMTSAISGEGRIQISEKIRANTKNSEDDEYAMIQSLFLDLQIAAGIPFVADPQPSLKLNGEIQFSIGNSWLAYEDGDDGIVGYYIPNILSFKLAPFKDVDIFALLNNESDSEDDVEPWDEIRSVLWPKAKDTDVLLSVTRTIGPLGEGLGSTTMTLTNKEAFEWLAEFELPMFRV